MLHVYWLNNYSTISIIIYLTYSLILEAVHMQSLTCITAISKTMVSKSCTIDQQTVMSLLHCYSIEFSGLTVSSSIPSVISASAVKCRHWILVVAAQLVKMIDKLYSIIYNFSSMLETLYMCSAKLSSSAAIKILVH